MLRLAMVCLIAAFGVAHAEGGLRDLPNEGRPDFSKMPIYHARHDGTLFCGNAQALLYIRSEVGPGPVDRTRFTYDAQRVCSTIPTRLGVKLWHEYRYTGISGQAHGPRIMQIVINDNLVGFVMADDVVAAVQTEYPH